MIGYDTATWKDAPLLSRADFEAAIRAVGVERYHDKHPFHQMLHGGKATREQVQAWALNRYCYQSAVPRKDAALVIPENTVVIVTADHGESFLHDVPCEHSTALRDETLHVPLIIAGPGVEAGRTAALTGHMDLLPMVLGLVDLPSPVPAR